MNKDTIKINYEKVGDAVNTVTTLNDALDTGMGNINTYKSALDSDDIFMGPVADASMEKFDEIIKSITTAIDNFKTISSYLEQARSNYETADEKSKELFLSINDKGALEITEGLAATPYVNPNASQTEVDFINRVLPVALELYDKYGILPSLTIAQACKESAFGTAYVGNNYYGIKATKGWEGKTVNARTGEQTPAGKTYHINADFRAYDSLEDSVRDYGEVLSQDFYHKVREAKDYKEAAHAVKAAGYATGVNYDNSLINDYIEPYNLNQWNPK